MTLIATGDVLRNRALQGLEYMSQEEAERERLRQQIKQAESAQKAQLAGTGLGIAGAAGVRYYGDEIRSGLSSIFGGGEQAALNLPAVTESGIQQTLAGTTKTGADVASVLGTPPVGSLEASLSNVGSNTAAVNQALATTKAGSGIGAATGTAKAGTIEAGISNAAANATGQTAASAATTAPAGGLTFGAIAAPLAIGIGAYFLLNALFD